MSSTASQSAFFRIPVSRKAVCGVLLSALLFFSCGKSQTKPTASVVRVSASQRAVVMATAAAEFDVLQSGYVQANLLRDGQGLTLDDPQMGSNPDYIESGGREVRDFVFNVADARIGDASGRFGSLGKRAEVRATSASVPGLELTETIEVYDDFPQVAVISSAYRNKGKAAISFDQEISDVHRLNATLSDAKAPAYQMWSFHGSSEAWGRDDVMPVTAKFERANTMEVIEHNDENQTGGGIPVVAFWTGSVGEAIGHLETVPLTVSLPVRTEADGRVTASIATNVKMDLEPGETYASPLTFVSVFHGDFFEPLRLYSRMLQKQGWSLARPTDADYQANWCGWGYELNFTRKQMLGTIPKLKELGLKWATLDAGWFTTRGDWEPRPEIFPDDSIKSLVRAYHDAGIHITLWWIPAIVEDGHGRDILNHKSYKTANVVKEHPDWLILDKNGQPARATAGLGALCPAIPEVKEYYKQLTERFIRDWDFDGSKLDFAYTVPACYNPKHHHQSPQDSVRALGELYRTILQTTRALKPDSVTQACPCGTPPNLAWLPYIDQAVTADPVGARQVRLRTKMYKALLGPEAAVYGDHVELTDVKLSNTTDEIDQGEDFASQVGVGAVVGTKFTWPDYGPHFKTVELTPAKEAHWKKWIDIYNGKMLSRGKFLDLYTYGYDFPEAYAIEKDGTMYYAFYLPDKGPAWSGEIELRGLEPGRYRVTDYEHGSELGTVSSEDPKLRVSFKEHLLLEVSR
jgi:alpha-galactosidase